MESSVSEEQVKHEATEDEPPREKQDQTDEETDVDCAVESDHSSSSSSCPDLPDEEETNNPEKGWISKSAKVWHPMNEETTNYVPSRGVTPGLTQHAITRTKKAWSPRLIYFSLLRSSISSSA